jgi:hypothetical protein
MDPALNNKAFLPSEKTRFFLKKILILIFYQKAADNSKAIK